MNWKTGLLAAIGAILIIALIDIALHARFVRAYLAQPDGFTSSVTAPTLHFQPEMADLAAEIETELANAVAVVEEAFDLPFPSPPQVYLCGTKRCFERMTGHSNPFIRGAAAPRGVIVSPDILEWRDSTLPIIIHELSHLMIKQRLGFLNRHPPAWFNEGFAVSISGGAGAERVSRADAIEAIRAGHHFDPIGQSRLFRPQTGRDYGLTSHMFYRQAWMFLEYLESREPDSVGDLANRVAGGQDFSSSFSSIYGASPMELWTDFEDALARQARATAAK